MKNLDWNAIRAGGSVALVFAIPFSIAARIVADNNSDSSAAPLLSLAALVGFVLGSGVAAWTQQLQLPLKHGLICAIGTYSSPRPSSSSFASSAATRFTGSRRSSRSHSWPSPG